MQELADDTVLKVEVNQTHKFVRSANPSGSAYSNANVWIKADPLTGVTDTGAGADDKGTVQVPIGCHPPLALDPNANMKTLFAPANPAANVTGRFKVRLFPDGTTVAVNALIEQLLLLSVTAEPGVAGV